MAAQPDAWVWLGDFAYLDYPSVNCALLPNSTQCSCADEATAFKIEPFCLSGDEQHSLFKYQTMLQNTEYKTFLDYMCPGAAAQGRYPPPGTNLEVCPRPVIGTWDDHDFGWNDGNALHPRKAAFKQLFLDAIGEAADSPRRNVHRGMWGVHTLNRGVPGREIDVFLLDERYNRSPLPCHMRRQWCEEEVLAPDADAADTHAAWCQDFLYGGQDGKGTCCKYDEQIQLGWCKVPAHQADPLWAEACDVTSPTFGMRSLVLDAATQQLRRPNGTEPVDIFQDSPFCEVLGREQRLWLRDALSASTAALRIIASGSVLLGSDGVARNPSPGQKFKLACSGDDWDCYNAAQRALIADIELARGSSDSSSNGSGSSACTVVLTGDFHYADIKLMQPGEKMAYAQWLGTAEYQRPLLQVMASGMTLSTAVSGRQCSGYLLDPAGLRDHPECDIVLDPNFGLLQVDWDEGGGGVKSVTAQIRDAKGAVRLQSVLLPSMCV
eukprot:TRINITY_DN151_c0_g1_i3.p1 TRINITY_DN151_c0_g1~~TRINITY_DN151_c0_g1_i3.p1  ORF type:complete len:494 (+),score=147.18 TRINITY_DN151_c0_g1_i3:660-2141(+)